MNKKIAIIGAATGQLPLCLKAKEMGLETYCFAWPQGAVCKDYVDHFIPVSIMEMDTIVRYCQEYGIDGVVSNASETTALVSSYVAEHIGVDEELVMERIRKPALQTAGYPRRTETGLAGKTVPSNTAEEDLLSWLLKYPQQSGLCEGLTAEDFLNQDTWLLFQAIIQAYKENPQITDLVQRAAEKAPEQKNRLIKLALLQTPTDFNPARDIAACVSRLEQTGLHKRMEKIKRQMKLLGAGNVPQEIFQEYMQLQNKLKKYRN